MSNLTPKKLLIIIAVAVVLVNGSIVGTLFMMGAFSSDDTAADGAEPLEENTEEPDEDEEAEEEADNDEKDSAKAVEGSNAPSKPRMRPSLTSAYYVCREKLKESNKNKRFSYQYNAIASKYVKETEMFFVFLDVETASRADEPRETSQVTCEVTAKTMTIENYKVMKK